jgi:ceramide glucosyltransferase
MSPSSLARSVEALCGGVDGVDESSLEVDAQHWDSFKTKFGRDAQPGDVGVVHHCPFAFIPQKSFGSRLEQAYLNTTHAKMYLAIVSRASRSRTTIKTETGLPHTFL